jgi:hypothetical protein
LMLFWWIKLCEARTQNVGLQEISTSPRGGLLHPIFDQPDFRPVISGRIAD